MNWKPNLIRLNRILAIPLCLSLSGLGPTLSLSLAAGAVNLQEISTQADELSKNLSSLLRRAKYPNTPGTKGGTPSSNEITQVESKLLNWKQNLENALTLPHAPTHPGAQQPFLSIEAKVHAVNMYFNKIATLISVRIALHLPHGPAWREPLTLHVPRNIMKDFPSLGKPQQNRAGEQFFSLIIDRGKSDRGESGKADPVLLRMSESLVQGLEIGELANDPNDETFLTVVQYLATRQLLQNLAGIRYLKSDHRTRTPEIPSTLQAKLNSLGLSSQILDEQHRVVAETGARTAIIDAYAGLSKPPTSFVTTEYVHTLVSILSTNPSKRLELRAPVKSMLEQAETEGTETSIKEDIQASNIPLSSLPSSELIPSLRYFLSNAKANTQVKKFLQLVSDGILQLTPKQRALILDTILIRRQRFSDELAESTLTAWTHASRARTEELIYSKERDRLIKELIKGSKMVSKKLREREETSTIKSDLLFQVFAGEIGKLSPRSSVKNWLQDIFREESYVSCRDKYTRIVTDNTDPSVLVNGLVEPDSARKFIDNHDFSATLVFSDAVPEKLRRSLSERISAGRKKDLQNLVALGERFGFHRIYSTVTPRLEEILTDSNKRKDYFKVLEEDTLSRFPILSTKLTYRSQNGKMITKTLANALTELPQGNATTELIDRAMTEVENQIHKNIKLVGKTNDVQKIEKVVTSALLLDQLFNNFPEFQIQGEDFLETLSAHPLEQQVVHRYLGWYVGGGYGALLLLHLSKGLIKRTGPIIDSLLTTLAPTIRGYILSTIPLMVFDTAVQWKDLRKTSSHRDQTRDFFFSKVAGQSFFDHAELKAAESSYQWNKWFFVGRVVLDGAFLYYPMLFQGMFAKNGTFLKARELFGDCTAFKRLRLPIGKWDQIDGAIDRLRNSTLTSSKQLVDAEMAYLRLSEKTRAGLAWDPAALSHSRALGQAEKTIQSILRSGRKSK